MDNAITALVVDNGSSVGKADVARHNDPLTIFPSIVGYPSTRV